MADLSYESFKNGKLKKAKSKNDLSYSAFLLKKQKLENVKQEKLAREQQGLPVSVRDDRATPTLLGGMIRSVAKPLADVGANLVNATRVGAGMEAKPVFKSKYLGDIKGLGQVDLTKSPWDKDNLKTIIKSAATGAEIASYLNATGVAKNTIAGLTKQGVLASKKTFAEWVVKTFPSLVKEGFGQGIAYTLGTQGREYADTGKPFSATQATKDVITSTVANVVIPSVLQKTFGASSKKILNARAAERAIRDAEILGKKIPDVGVPSAKFMQESGRMLPTPRKPGEIPIELPGKGLLESAENLRKPVKQIIPDKPKTPEIIRAERFSSKADFIESEKTFLKRTKQITEKNPIKQKELDRLGKIWDEAHATPKEQPLAQLPTQEIPTQQITPETPTPKIETPTQPKIDNEVPNTPKAKEIPEETLNKDADSFKDEFSDGFDYGTFKEWSAQVRNLDREEALAVAMGGKKKTPNNVPEGAYLSIMKNIADETKDTKLAQQLAMSNVISRGAQTTVSAKMAIKGNVSDMLRDIRTAFLKKKGVTTEKFLKEEKDLVKKIKTKLKETSNEVISSLICK